MINKLRTHRRRIGFAGLLLVALAVALWASASRDASRPATWVDQAVATAEAVDLRTAYDRAMAGGIGTVRVAVQGSFIYVESTALAGPEVESADGEGAASVVKARLPYPASDFISDLVRQSPHELEILENPVPERRWFDVFLSLVPVMIMLALVIFILRRGAMKSLGLGDAFNLVQPSEITDSFDTVAGIDEARAEIAEIVAFLKDPAGALPAWRQDAQGRAVRGSSRNGQDAARPGHGPRGRRALPFRPGELGEPDLRRRRRDEDPQGV